MRSPMPVTRYAVLPFPDVEGAITYCHRVVDLLLSPPGIAYTVSPERPVLWLLPPDAPSARTRFIQAGCVVFASQGALRAANAAGVAVAANANVAQFIGAEELPTGCALAFGDSLVDQRP